MPCRCWRPPVLVIQAGRDTLTASCSVGWSLRKQGRETALLSAARAAQAGGPVLRAGGHIPRAGGLVERAGGNQKL